MAPRGEIAKNETVRRNGTEVGFAAGLRHVCFAVVCALALALPSPPARAQDWPPARAQDWPSTWAFNWSQSPLLLDLHQYGGFNTNVFNSPPGVAPRASALTQTSFGALGRLYEGEQKVFIDARFTALDFAQEKAASLHDQQFDMGLDWRVGNSCLGRLIATASDKQDEVADLAGPGLDSLRLRLIDQSGRCALYGAFGLVFAAAAASRRHSSASAMALDNDAIHGKLGLDYDGSQLDHAELSAKYTALHFPLGAPSAVSGDNAGQGDQQFAYKRILSPQWRAQTMVGVSEGPAPDDGQLRAVGVYDADLIWAPTDLWRATLGASRTLDAPVSIRAAAQLAQAQRLSLSWQPTRKLTLTGEIARLQLESGPSAGLYGGSTLASLSARAIYQFTPFTSLTASLQRAERTSSGGTVPTTIAMISIDCKPF